MIKTRAGREIVLPTSDEDAAINAAALGDPDAQPLSDSELAQLRPALGRRVDVDVLSDLRAGEKGG